MPSRPETAESSSFVTLFPVYPIVKNQPSGYGRILLVYRYISSVYFPVTVCAASHGVVLGVPAPFVALVYPVHIKQLIGVARAELALAVNSFLDGFVDQLLTSSRHAGLYIYIDTTGRKEKMTAFLTSILAPFAGAMLGAFIGLVAAAGIKGKKNVLVERNCLPCDCGCECCGQGCFCSKLGACCEDCKACKGCGLAKSCCRCYVVHGEPCACCPDHKCCEGCKCEACLRS